MRVANKHKRPRLTETQKQAIIGTLALGHTQADVAAMFKVHPNTLGQLWKNVKKETNSPLSSTDWRSILDSALGPVAKTIRKAVKDDAELYKAAISACKLLTGLGFLRGENDNSTSLLIQLNNSLPEDLRLDIIETPDVIDVHDLPNADPGPPQLRNE